MNTQPVALSAQLQPKQVIRVKFVNADLAVWRSASGVVSAWENRCPHRGMRLSHGFVRGESLACAYHGWHYDCSGQCHKIPAHPQLKPPATVQVSSFSVKEQDGIVWVDTNAIASPVALPENLKAVRSLTFASSVEQAVTAFSTVPLTDDRAESLPGTTVSNNPTIISFNTADHTDGICIALQQQEQESVVCHVMALETMTLTELRVISRWCEAVRRRAETMAKSQAENTRQAEAETVATE